MYIPWGKVKAALCGQERFPICSNFYHHRVRLQAPSSILHGRMNTYDYEPPGCLCNHRTRYISNPGNMLPGSCVALCRSLQDAMIHVQSYLHLRLLRPTPDTLCKLATRFGALMPLVLNCRIDHDESRTFAFNLDTSKLF